MLIEMCFQSNHWIIASEPIWLFSSYSLVHIWFVYKNLHETNATTYLKSLQKAATIYWESYILEIMEIPAQTTKSNEPFTYRPIEGK